MSYRRGYRQEVVEFRADDRRLRTSLTALRGRVAAINQSLAAMAQTAKVAVAAMSLGLLSIVRIGQQVEYHLAEAGLAATATSKELRQMTELAEHLGRTTPKTTADIALSMKSLAKAGFEVNEILGLTPTIVNQAVAAGVSVEESGIAMIRVYKQFGNEVKDAKRFVEIMLKLSTMANVTVTELGYRMGQAGETAKALGLEFAEAASGIAMLSDVLGENSGIYFRALTKDLVEKQEELEELSIRVYDAEGGVRSLAAILRDFESLTAGGTAQEVAEITNVMGNSRSLVSLLNFLKRGSDELERFTKQALDSRGELERFVSVLGNTGRNIMYEMISAIQDLSIKLYKHGREDVVKFYLRIRNAARWLSNNIETTGKIVSRVFKFAVALAGLAVFNTMVGISVKAVRTFWAVLTVGFVASKVFVAGLWAAAAGFKALTAATIVATARMRTFWAVTTLGLSLLLTEAITALVNWFSQAKEETGSATGGIIKMFADLWTGLRNAIAYMKFGWMTLGDYMLTTIQMRTNDILVVFGEMAARLEKIGNKIRKSLGMDANTSAAEYLADVYSSRQDIQQGFDTRHSNRKTLLADELAGKGGGGGLLAGTAVGDILNVDEEYGERGMASTHPDEMTFEEFGAQYNDSPAAKKLWDSLTDEQKAAAYEQYVDSLSGDGGGELDEEGAGLGGGDDLISDEERWEKARQERLAEEDKKRKEDEYNRLQDHLDAMEALKNEKASVAERLEKIRDTKQYKRAKSLHDDLLKLEQEGFHEVKALRKALAIMELGIDLATKPPEAYAKTSAAYPQPLGHILGIAHAAIVTATLVKGMANVAKMATGGTVPGVDKGTDSVHTMLTPGELVVPKAYRDEVLERMASIESGGGNVPETITVIFQADGRTLARQVVEIASEEGVI